MSYPFGALLCCTESPLALGTSARHFAFHLPHGQCKGGDWTRSWGENFSISIVATINTIVLEKWPERYDKHDREKNRQTFLADRIFGAYRTDDKR